MPKKKRAKYDGGGSVKFSTNLPSVGHLNVEFDPNRYSADIGTNRTRVGVRGSTQNPSAESVHASTKVRQTDIHGSYGLKTGAAEVTATRPLIDTSQVLGTVNYDSVGALAWKFKYKKTW